MSLECIVMNVIGADFSRATFCFSFSMQLKSSTKTNFNANVCVKKTRIMRTRWSCDANERIRFICTRWVLKRWTFEQLALPFLVLPLAEMKKCLRTWCRINSRDRCTFVLSLQKMCSCNRKWLLIMWFVALPGQRNAAANMCAGTSSVHAKRYSHRSDGVVAAA